MKVTTRRKKLIASGIAALLAIQITGCATIPEAIEYRNLYTNYKMSDTIFLDVTKRMKYRNIFVEVKNTSQLREVNTEVFKGAIAQNLAAKGYNVVVRFPFPKSKVE